MAELLGPAPLPPFGAVPVQQPEALVPYSGLGVAAFVISVVCTVAIFTTLVFAAVAGASTDGVVDEHAPGLVLVGLVILLFLLVALVGIALGIVAVAQKRRRKLFAWLGLGINALVVLGTVALIILGSSLP